MSDIERTGLNSARAVRVYNATPEALLAATRSAIERLPRWTLASDGEARLEAVRTTRLFRFKDDVTVRVFATENGVRAEFGSTSRIGVHDLGQNVRNLRELIKATDREFL